MHSSWLASGRDSETDSLGMPLVLLEGGRYVRGTDGGERAITKAFPLSTSTQFFGNAEFPAHVTWITKPFWIGKHEVTVGQWKKFVDATGYVTTAEQYSEGIVGWSPTPEDEPLYHSHDFERKSEFTWKKPGFEQTDDHPVVGVSWIDARAFLDWLSEEEEGTYRLPTEAEWEFACRAGSEGWFSFGDEPRGVVHRHANLGNVELEKYRTHSAERQWLLDWTQEPEDGHVFTAPVGSYEPNAFSLHDMHGNVWEMCQDLWLDTFYKRYDWPERGRPRGTAIDPVNESEPQTEANRFRTIRGGSWYNGPVICRASNRTGWDEPDAACYVGFRVVREVDQGASIAVKEALEKEQAARAVVEKFGGDFYATRGLDLEVRFEKTAFSNEALVALAGIPGIESLSLAYDENVILSAADLAAISNITSLKELEFRAGFDLSEVDLGVLANLPGLESLQFSRSTSLTDEKIAELGDLTTLKTFRCYGASGGLTDAGISCLSPNRGLESLELFEVNANGSFISKFSGCPLTVFALTRGSEDESGLIDENARKLEGFSDLTKLQLTQQGLITDLTLLSLGNLTNLEDLGLHGCSGLSADGFGPLGELINLRSLNLQGTPAGDKAVAALSSIPRIETLRLGAGNLTDRGFADLAKMFSIQNLYIEDCAATDAGLPHIGRINRLKRLDIGGPNFTGAELGPIARLPEINDVKLRSPALTDLVFEQFARSKSLRKLRLVERGWQPPGAFTNEGILAIAPATWLTELWLPRNDTGITEEGMKELGKLMPKTSVIPYSVDWDRPEEAGE